MDQRDLPQAFNFLLAQSQEAMERFAALSDAERQDVIDTARSARSKAEMRSCVESLTK